MLNRDRPDFRFSVSAGADNESVLSINRRDAEGGGGGRGTGKGVEACCGTCMWESRCQTGDTLVFPSAICSRCTSRRDSPLPPPPDRFSGSTPAIRPYGVISVRSAIPASGIASFVFLFFFLFFFFCISDTQHATRDIYPFREPSPLPVSLSLSVSYHSFIRLSR